MAAFGIITDPNTGAKLLIRTQDGVSVEVARTSRASNWQETDQWELYCKNQDGGFSSSFYSSQKEAMDAFFKIVERTFYE